MPELIIRRRSGGTFPFAPLLEWAVSMPVMVNMAEALPQTIRAALERCQVPKTLPQGMDA